MYLNISLKKRKIQKNVLENTKFLSSSTFFVVLYNKFYIFVYRMKKYTIKDIAKLAGVSKGTVDRVLHKRGKVSNKALEKVNQVLKEIDFQPNPIARNLKNNKIYQICIVLPNPDEDIFWKPCVDGINDAKEEFKAFGISINPFFYSPSSTETFFKINKEILNSNPDAVILSPLFYKESIEVVKTYNSKNIIVSTFNNEVSANQIGCFVGQDLFQSGRVAAKLMNMVVDDKSKIVIIHIDESINNALHMQEKEKGFRNYFKDLFNSEYELVTLNVLQSELYKSLSSLLKSKKNISGIFVTTSKAYKVVQILEKENYQNVKIIGYDLLDENVQLMESNYINFLIHQNPKMQTYISLTYLIEHFLFNKEIPNKKLLPIDIVNSENVQSYIQ